jgi:uncharacterized protein (DUF362 family)
MEPRPDSPGVEQLFRCGDVAIARAGEARYPGSELASPPVRPPEFPYPADEPWDSTNTVYPAVREALRLLELDARRYGSPDWNPLRSLVSPGDRVLIKPNYVLHQHLRGLDPFSVITHTSVIRTLIDYVVKALDGRGRIVVADAPQANADWNRLLAVTGIERCLTQLRSLHGVQVELLDLRKLRVVQRHGITVARTLTEAPVQVVEMGESSALAPLGRGLTRLCGSDYDRHRTVAHHRQGHRYAVARDLLQSDVLISVPKLKVHKKTGVSVGLKNLVGINTDKNHIPHYRVGDPRSGGDEFPDEPLAVARLRDRCARLAIDTLLGRLDRVAAPLLSRLLGLWSRRAGPETPLDATDAGYNSAVIRFFYRSLLGKPVRAGNWSGNDTLWRAIVDLNRIAAFADADGRLLERTARRQLVVADGIVAGEGEGPMDPDPRPAGVVLAGFNPLAVDTAAARLMGLDPKAIPLLNAALVHRCLGWHGTPVIRSNHPAWNGGVEPGSELGFRPPSGWPELRRAPAASSAAEDAPS